jgi:molybdopterin converting factor subunit 1
MHSTIPVLLFGIARDLTGQSTVSIPFSEGVRVGDLLGQLHERYPALTGIRSILIAVNGEYAEAEQLLTDRDEIAVIPPVSGG